MRIEYQKPDYEIILLSGTSVITASPGDWETPEVSIDSIVQQSGIWE